MCRRNIGQWITAGEHIIISNNNDCYNISLRKCNSLQLSLVTGK